MEFTLFYVFGMLAILVLIAGLSCLPAVLLMLFWNVVIADIFHIQQISFFQAWLISVVIVFIAGLFTNNKK